MPASFGQPSIATWLFRGFNSQFQYQETGQHKLAVSHGLVIVLAGGDEWLRTPVVWGPDVIPRNHAWLKSAVGSGSMRLGAFCAAKTSWSRTRTIRPFG
jgi:hypothetical protein